jgi:hypothetical protein
MSANSPSCPEPEFQSYPFFLRSFLCLPTIALKVSRHLSAQRKVLGIEAFNLFNACAGVLGEVEDIDLPVAEHNPYKTCRMVSRAGLLIHSHLKFRGMTIQEPNWSNRGIINGSEIALTIVVASTSVPASLSSPPYLTAKATINGEAGMAANRNVSC